MGSISYLAGGSLVSIEFDLIVTENHTRSADITAHPTEKGSPVTDNVRAKPKAITVQAFVTDTPIRAPTTNLDGTKGTVSDVTIEYPVKWSLPIGIPLAGTIMQATGTDRRTETAKATVLQFDGEVNRVRSIYNELTLLVDSCTPVTIETKLETYEDMQIESLQAPREAKDGGSIVFVISAKQLRYVETTTVPVPKDKLGASKSNKGLKPAADVTKTNQSAFYKLLHP
jgi:hypothetical protein